MMAKKLLYIMKPTHNIDSKGVWDKYLDSFMILSLNLLIQISKCLCAAAWMIHS
ncbi:hypothetical protein HanPSC8_Chr04g0144421 [Helianthus annuus]|nr:hypothetical protein HanPSC8_Chr04g0144421 [Helianthus annuus]